MLKFLLNRYFIIGFFAHSLLTLISDFSKGERSLSYAIFNGVLGIILIAMNVYFIKKYGDER